MAQPGHEASPPVCPHFSCHCSSWGTEAWGCGGDGQSGAVDAGGVTQLNRVWWGMAQPELPLRTPSTELWGGGGVSPFGEGGCKGTGGLCSPLGDVVTPITAPAQHMAHCVPPLHPSQGARCPQTHPIPEPRAPGAGPRRTAQLGMAGSLGVCHQCLRLCASCEPAPLEFAQEAGNRGRRRARANGGGGERARVRGAQLHCRGSAWAHGEDMRGDYRCCAAMGL